MESTKTGIKKKTKHAFQEMQEGKKHMLLIQNIVIQFLYLCYTLQTFCIFQFLKSQKEVHGTHTNAFLFPYKFIC